MKTTRGIIIAVLASLAFGTSGAFVKPLFEVGWSPAAAVALRALAGSVILAPFAIVALRGRWSTVWKGRWRILGMALVGVAGCQLVYFMAVERIPVGTAILVEYTAPVLLVLFAWATTRRMPRAVVLVGSAVAIVGLVLVIGPGALASVDLLGVLFAFLAAIGAAGYYLIAARPSEGLPGVALAWLGLFFGSVILFAVGGLRAVPFDMVFTDVPFLGGTAPWWVSLGIVVLFATALGYAASITATGMLGSRLMSFIALLEVVFATMFAWLWLGEQLTLSQLLGGALILAGIVFVYSERRAAMPVEPLEMPAASEPTETAPTPTEPVPTRP
ncbi:MAG: multidrug DMT transporter permease [Micrococcales bacterium 70-64]|nr:DMT family transporter [Leifsonia sp.]ODU64665.1 MAG: multidrug DMT transporter permease [Leifsonia sp. SCN 70-46]OJX86356.1 MAG: multidrug DMT transporter permease [Micrococcales bacterium 70-64]